MERRGLRIGITIGLHAPDESLWINGIKQNAIFLAKLLQNSPLGHEVVLLNTTSIPITDRLPWDVGALPTAPFADRCDGLDILIELGGQIGPDQSARIKAQGTKLVSYSCGSEYVQNMEAMIFRRPLWDGLFINPDYDEIWIIPQNAPTTLPFLQTFRRCPARAVPFIWDPCAIAAVSKDLPEGGEYRPRSGARRVSVIEPNVDVLKFCMYPILATEQAFRKAPDQFEILQVANSDHMVHDDREFAGLMRHLDIVKAGKAFFHGRVRTPDFLSGHTDIVVSHQWGVPLNYFYLECCWQGFPFVHNAGLIKDLGYYYPENEIDVAARHILSICADHDADWRGYSDQQRRLIQRFLSSDPDLISTYDDLLFGLFADAAAPARTRADHAAA